MFYYLVGLLDEDSYSYIEKIQKNISNKYNLYNNLPTLHITLEIIKDPNNMDKLFKIIQSILEKHGAFYIDINGVICFQPPFKSVNLKIENTEPVISITKELNKNLKENGFNVRENIDNWDLHISLANTNFSKRNWSTSEFIEACDITSKNNILKKAKITEIQLWKPINDKSKMVVKHFYLK